MPTLAACVAQSGCENDGQFFLISAKSTERFNLVLQGRHFPACVTQSGRERAGSFLRFQHFAAQ